ncbi:PD-(D/E)XK nuclease family protein [Thermosipho ferrireducens]|uniref:PD-(D/E)XK nuclease family protein n=1 Tax=Thermosipho ferrireducens TaxID=2571116 RepID=A0ABX7S780_9BACT|nr:PD-(D/E)XK nuclease family protein [Thermosipho ferrireducens]QTA38458.1 PD-(D/E)XK nuclease family protein [Thermosipho ferrireducens]
MKKAIVIELSKNHFDEIASRITDIYIPKPFSSLFIGPTGFYVRQIADKIARKINKTLNRDAFRVINQYVTETLVRNNFDAIVLDREFFKVFIAGEIEELIKRYEKKRDDYYDFLKVVSRSSGVIDYILEIFEKAWELKNSTEDNLSYQYQEIQEILLQENFLSRLVNELLDEINDIFKSSTKLYDPITVYKWYIENAHYVEKKKENLIISGFFDLTPLLKDVLKKMFELSENVYFYVWDKVEDRAFEEIDKIYSFLEENGFEFENVKTRSKRKLIDIVKGIKVYYYKDPTAEIKLISGEIKKLLIEEKAAPGDIAVIAPTSQIMLQIAEEFKEMLVPYRLAGIIKLSDSKIVKMLLQPLKTIYGGYDTEDLLAIIESPFIKDRVITMDQIEKLFKEFGFYALDLKPSDYKNWTKINEYYIKPINRKIEELSKVIDDDTYEDRQKKIEEYTHFRYIVEKTFKMLFDIQNNLKKKDFITWFKKFIKNQVSQLELFKNSVYKEYLKEDSLVKELNALGKFVEVIEKVENNTGQLFKNQRVKWETMYKILTNIVNIETFKTTNRYSNAVEILDIQTARFVKKKYKFFIHFTDGYYPSLNVNPLILQATKDPKQIKKFNETLERRNIILSFSFAENIIVSAPLSTLTGEPLLISQYIKEFFKKEGEFYQLNGILPDAQNIYSLQDKEIFEHLIKNHSRRLTTNISNWIGNFDENTLLSHSKISDFVDCPFLFYLKVIANVKPLFEEKYYLYKGILYHRVLEKLFRENTFTHETEINENKIRKIVEKEYEEIFIDEMSRYSIPKNLLIEEFTDNLYSFLKEHLSEKGYVQIAGKYSLHKKKTLKTEAKYRKSIALNKKQYNFEVRIDRIDEIGENFMIFEGKNAKEISKALTKSNKKAYALIDYKNSLSRIIAEQLLIYDLVVRKGGFSNENSYDSFLIFFGIERKNNKKSFFIKHQVTETENGTIEELIIPGAGKSKSYFVLPYKFFLNWLEFVIENISSGYFVPIAVEKKLNRFLTYAARISEKNLAESGENKEKKCINYHQSCYFADICNSFEIYENVRLLK